MKRLHIIGNRNNGKTTLVVELVEALTARGYVVGTLKHTSHLHDLDTPGKDSWRHRHAGGNPSSIVTPELIGLFLPRPKDVSTYEWLAPMYAHCDLVLVEGDRDTEAPKVEVWRKVKGKAPIATQKPSVLALISDDDSDLSLPVWPRSDVEQIVENLVSLMELSARAK